MLNKEKIFLITALLYILYTIFPLFADLIRIPVWLPSIAAVAVMVMLYPMAFSNKTFHWLLVYGSVLGLYVVFGKPLTIGIGTVHDSKKIFIELAYILPTIGIFSILRYLDDIDLTRKLVNWSIGMLFMSFIVEVPLMQSYGSIRAAMGDDTEEFHVLGLPSYSLMHAYTLFLPVLCYGEKSYRGRKKWWMLVGMLVLCFVVYNTFVTTSLILMLAILVFTIFYSDKGNMSLFIIFGVVAIVLFTLYKSGAFISLIDWMMPAFEGTPVEGKLIDFKASMLLGHVTGGNITTRQNLHSISWQSFYSKPLFGTGVVGGHSVLIDRLGGMGLVAFVPFVFIFVSFIVWMHQQYATGQARTFFWVGIVAGIVYLYQKGLWGGESWLMYMVLMPMGILSIEKNRIND